MRALTGLAMLVFVAATPSVAGAAWREERLPSGDVRAFLDAPSIAANARGDIAVAWSVQARRGVNASRSFVAVRRAGTTRFGRPIALRRGSQPQVAVLSDATVLIATERDDGTATGRLRCCHAVYVSRLGPRSRRPTAPRIATTRGISVGAWSLAAGARGRAALVANVDGPALTTSRGAGVFGTLISPSYERVIGGPFVGFGGDRRGVALWGEGEFGAVHRLMGAPIGRGGEIGRVRSFLSAADARDFAGFEDLQAGLDARSRVTAIWRDSGTGILPASSISVATGTAAGLGRPQVLATSGQFATGVVAPALAVARNGRAVAGWRSFGPGGERNVVAIRSGPATAFRVLAPEPGFGAGVRVAIVDDGHAVVVSGVRGRAIVRVLDRNGTFGAARALAGRPTPTRVGLRAVGGRIVLVWGTRTGLRAATYSR